MVFGLKHECTAAQEFLEDYDDEKDDIKYYRGRELARRLADR
jgi:RNA-binding protein 25